MQSVLYFLNDNQGALMVVITAIYVLATILICRANSKSADMSKKQLVQQEKISRATFVHDLYMKLFNDDEIRALFYSIEWSDYKPKNPVGYSKTDSEKAADKLLALFDLVCSMYYNDVLKKEDLSVMDYEMLRFYLHPDTQSYLSFLQRWQKIQNIGRSYESYSKYCSEKLAEIEEAANV